MRRYALIVVAVVACAAGCGSGGGKESKELSRPEFVRQGNTICDSFEKRLKRLAQPQSLANIGPYIDKAGRLIERELGDLKALTPPSELQAGYASFLASAQRELVLTQRLSAAAKAGDAAKVRGVIDRAERLDERTNKLARRVGLNVCGQAPPSG